MGPQPLQTSPRKHHDTENLMNFFHKRTVMRGLIFSLLLAWTWRCWTNSRIDVMTLMCQNGFIVVKLGSSATSGNSCGITLSGEPFLAIKVVRSLKQYLCFPVLTLSNEVSPQNQVICSPVPVLCFLIFPIDVSYSRCSPNLYFLRPRFHNP